MILAGDFEGFGLFGADVFLGAFDAGMAKEKLGRAQIAGLLVNMRGEGPAQRVQTVEAGIEAGLFQPGAEETPKLTFAEMAMRPPWPLPREEPSMQRLLRGGKISAQTVARARREPRLNRTNIAAFGLLLPDLYDLAHPGRRGDIRDPQAHQI